MIHSLYWLQNSLDAEQGSILISNPLVGKVTAISTVAYGHGKVGRKKKKSILLRFFKSSLLGEAFSEGFIASVSVRHSEEHGFGGVDVFVDSDTE